MILAHPLQPCVSPPRSHSAPSLQLPHDELVDLPPLQPLHDPHLRRGRAPLVCEVSGPPGGMPVQRPLHLATADEATADYDRKTQEDDPQYDVEVVLVLGVHVAGLVGQIDEAVHDEEKEEDQADVVGHGVAGAVDHENEEGDEEGGEDVLDGGGEEEGDDATGGIAEGVRLVHVHKVVGLFVVDVESHDFLSTFLNLFWRCVSHRDKRQTERQFSKISKISYPNRILKPP